MLLVVGPANFPEMRHPTGDGHVAQIAAAMNELRPRKEARQQPQKQVVVRHLVDDAKGRADSARSLSKCREARRWAVSRSNWRRPSRESVPCPPRAAMVSSASLISPAPKTWRVAGQDLLDERRAGARQPHDKHRESRSPIPKPRTRSKKSGVQTAIMWLTEDSCSCGSYSRPRLRHSASCSALPRSRCSAASAYSPRASKTWARPKCNNNRCASVRSVCYRRQNLLQQPALLRQILLWQFAAQEFRQFGMCKGEAGIVPQRGAEAVFRPLKIARSLPRRCPGCRGPRQSPASVPVPGGNRQLLRPASPGPSTHYPGCCVPRRSPASVPVPGGSRRPLPPASPGP